MRILIATQNYFQPNNGQATFVAHLADGLARGGHEVVVVTPSDRRQAYSLQRGCVRIETFASLSLAPFYSDVYITPRAEQQAARMLDAFRPDIVHIQDHFPLCRGVTEAAYQLRLPLIGTNHFLPENIIPFVPILSRSAWCRARMERLLWRMVVRVFQRLKLATAPSETAAAILRRQNLAIPIYTISNGVDLDRFHPDDRVDRAEMRRRYGLAVGKALLLFVGRVDREKRLDVLLRALHLLDRDDVQLAIVGRGRDLQTLQALARRLELGERVVFAGFVPGEDLSALLNSADVFAMPSEAELQSIATLEAMATGLPILAADSRALPELVEDGLNGSLFRAGDAAHAAQRITQLLAERDLWKELGAASLTRAQAHGLPATLQRFEEMYKEVVSGQ